MIPIRDTAGGKTYQEERHNKKRKHIRERKKNIPKTKQPVRKLVDIRCASIQ